MKRVILTLFIFLAIALPKAIAKCAISTLLRMCDVCEERAISKLNIDSLCPKQECPEVNCPTASLACIRIDSFEPFLKQNYTISAKLGEMDLVMKFNLTKNEQAPNTFHYDIRQANYRLLIDKAVGFLVYDIVNFNLPLQYGESILSYSCVGSIDNSSIIKGLCSTIAPDENKKPNSYGFEFTAIPSFSPL